MVYFKEEFKFYQGSIFKRRGGGGGGGGGGGWGQLPSPMETYKACDFPGEPDPLFLFWIHACPAPLDVPTWT